MTVKSCPHCGAELSAEFRFCPSCGKQLPDELSGAGRVEPGDSHNRSEVLVCPTCGFINHSGARACESCGTFLGGARKEPVEEQSAPQTTRREEEKTHPENRPHPGKEKKKERSQVSQQKSPARKRFHLETSQTAAIAAALLLGGIFVYGLLTSRSTQTGTGGGSMPSQQTATAGQPSADILHEIDRLREVVNKNPEDIGSVLRLSNMLQDNGFYDQAAIYYKRYLDKVPKNVDARVDYGVTLFEGGHTQEAIAQLKDALKIDPKHQIGLYNLGIVFLNAGEFEKANAAFKECVKVDPNSDIGKKAQQTLEQHANITSQEVN